MAVDQRRVIGEACALLAALTWAMAVVLFRRSERVDAQGLNLFKNVVAALLLAATLPVLGLGVDWARSGEDWLRLVVSGVLGLALADTLVFVALRRLGPALLATVDTAYAPTIVLLSVLILNEPLPVGLVAGGTLVLAGVLLATTERRTALAGALRREVQLGVAAGVAGIVLMALGVVIVKPVLERGELVEVTLVRLVAGVSIQMLWMSMVPSGRSALQAFRPSVTWKTLIPASLLGSYVAMLFWLGGFKWANASIAAVLNQMSTVFIIILSRVVLKEKVSARRAAGAAVALVGACLVLTL